MTEAGAVSRGQFSASKGGRRCKSFQQLPISKKQPQTTPRAGNSVPQGKDVHFTYRSTLDSYTLLPCPTGSTPHISFRHHSLLPHPISPPPPSHPSFCLLFLLLRASTFCVHSHPILSSCALDLSCLLLLRLLTNPFNFVSFFFNFKLSLRPSVCKRFNAGSNVPTKATNSRLGLTVTTRTRRKPSKKVLSSRDVASEPSEPLPPCVGVSQKAGDLSVLEIKNKKLWRNIF